MSQSERLPGGVRHHRKPEAEAIVWANWTIAKDPGVRLTTFFGLLVWPPATLLVVALFASEAYALLQGTSSLAQSWPMLFFSGVILILLSWLGLRGPVYGLLRLTWTESLIVSDTAISLFYSGPFAPKEKWIEKEAFLGIALERDSHNVGDTDPS